MTRLEDYRGTYNALGERDVDEQEIVLKALSIKDPQLAIEHTIAVLGNSDEQLALFAFQLLEQIHPAIIPEIIQEARSLFQGGKPGHFLRTLSMNFVADVLGDIQQAEPSLIAKLSDLLNWPYWETRMKAGKIRHNIPDTAIRCLLELRHDPQSRAVREAADEALAEILSLETGIEDD